MCVCVQHEFHESGLVGSLSAWLTAIDAITKQHATAFQAPAMH